MTWTAVHILERRQWVPRELQEAFEFFQRPQDLQLITPPWLAFRIASPEPLRMARGLTIDYTLRVLGFRVRWRSLITEYDPPSSFRDVQVIGPYRSWDHCHRFSRAGGGTVIEDLVRYQVPLGPAGRVLNRVIVRPRLEAIFDYRRARIAMLLDSAGASVPHRPGAESDATPRE